MSRAGSTLEREASSEPALKVRIQRLLADALRHHQAGHPREAELLSYEILALDPNHAESLNLLGLIAHQTGDYETAIDLIGKAIVANGEVATYYSNLGSALQAQTKLDEAVEQYKQALIVDPHYAVAYHNLGCALQAQGKLKEAIASYERAIELNPNRVEPHRNLGTVLREQGALTEAKARFERALAMNPDDAESCNQLGIALQAQGRFEAALTQYKQALALKPGDTITVWNQSLMQLLLGDFASGWSNYESRWTALKIPYNLPQPQWRGEPLNGARILLYAEQGLGDTLQFLRYVPLVQAAGGSVMLEVQTPLLRIAAELPGVAELMASGEPLPNFLWQCPLMSLPLAFATTLDTIPTRIPYLSIPDEALDAAAELPWPATGLRVGLVWAGNPEHHNNRYRSISLPQLQPLFDIEGVNFFSLQMGSEAEQLATLQTPITDLRHAIDDMADTAALIAHLDLVIAVDTAVVHLVGAIGKPAWLLLPFVPDWRWLLDRNDSPWYPSMRLFRQPALNDWQSVVKNLRQALVEKAADFSAGERNSVRFDVTAPGSHKQPVRKRERVKFLTVQKLFKDATDHHRVGRLVEAEQLYRQILTRNDRHAESLHLLGMIEFKAGQYEQAVALIRKAIDVDGSQANYHSNLGNVFRAEGKHEEAQARYERALALKPDYVEADYNLALVLQLQGKIGEAIAQFEKTISFKPDFVEAHAELARALQFQGKNEEAIRSYERALSLRPDSAEACYDLGRALQAHGKLDESVPLYARALALKPDYVGACTNLGAVFQSVGKLVQAEVFFRRVIALQPDFAEGYSNLAAALQDQGRLLEAAATYRRAHEIKPDLALAHHGLLFCLSHSSAIAPEASFNEHLRFASLFEEPLQPHWPKHQNARDAERRLRIGFVSGDLRAHAMSGFIEPIFAHLAQETSLSLHAYSTSAIEDDVTARLCGYIPHWNRVFALPDHALAAKIQADKIDILVDLTGHTAPSRLLTMARKPAPIQCGWIGYLGTSGLKSMDYYLGDRYFLPPGEFDRYFTEKIVHLPVIASFQPSQDAPAINPLPALENGFVTFGSFSRRSKLSREVIALWSQLLRAIPDARMLLAGMPRDGKYESLSNWFAEEGIAADRLQFHLLCGGREYLELHHQVDLCLDPFPFTGATTTCNALWMGVPTLTLSGQTVAGRLGPALLQHAKLNDFVVFSEQDFVEKGLHWARNLDSLAQLRSTMRERFLQSPIGQPGVAAHGLALAFRQMWRTWCAEA